jgi:hypothetical protein
MTPWQSNRCLIDLTLPVAEVAPATSSKPPSQGQIQLCCPSGSPSQGRLEIYVHGTTHAPHTDA